MKNIVLILIVSISFISCTKYNDEIILEEKIKDVNPQSLEKEKLAYLSFENFWNNDMIEFSKNSGLNNPIEYSFFINNIKVTQKIYLLDFALFINDKKLINEFKKNGAKRACEILKTKCDDIKGISSGDK